MRRKAHDGFTLVEIMIVVTIIGLIVAIALPNFAKTRVRTRQKVCIENLSQIESAKQIWGVEHNKKDGDVPTEDDLIGPTQYIKKSPSCPAAGVYDYQGIGILATCTIDGHSLNAD